LAWQKSIQTDKKAKYRGVKRRIIFDNILDFNISKVGTGNE
jgi:hypothetical protein